MILTYKYRIKDRRAAKRLLVRARAVNQIWNWAAAHHRHLLDRYAAGRPAKSWPSKFDLEKLLGGSSKEVGLLADSINLICGQFVASRGKRAKPLAFRSSFGTRRALGWVPFKGRACKIVGNRITYQGQDFRWFGDRRRPLPGPVKTGAFVEDSQGRWWVVFQIEVERPAAAQTGEVGIDLGLKSLATLSNGEVIDNPRHLRAYAERLAVAQRAGNRRRARAIHAKIANVRRDFHHKLSTRLAREHAFIAVGDVSAKRLAKTRMAKSVLDAGWSSLRQMLAYKAVVYVEVDERFTTQSCSGCGSIAGPKGLAGLNKRTWDCPDCGESHDRDVNSAKVILMRARSVPRPVEGSREIAA